MKSKLTKVLWVPRLIGAAVILTAIGVALSSAAHAAASNGESFRGPKVDRGALRSLASLSRTDLGISVRESEAMKPMPVSWVGDRLRWVVSRFVDAAHRAGARIRYIAYLSEWECEVGVELPGGPKAACRLKWNGDFRWLYR